ncbi:hypothetical protein SDC9_132484 [bioreactor metagenome]|uniref:Uncharacterized protein n=1 Tax=bioreactor metagenome TaxID=1076179 RepID=A0A645D8X7_9ZZZZ
MLFSSGLPGKYTSIFKILFKVSDLILPVCYNVITRLKNIKINSNKLDMSLEIYKKIAWAQKTIKINRNLGLGFIEDVFNLNFSSAIKQFPD